MVFQQPGFLGSCIQNSKPHTPENRRLQKDLS
jgi:hypothetical protein